MWKIVSIFLVTAALIIGMIGLGTASPSAEIRDWYDLDAIRHNLAGNYTLVNNLNSTTPGYEELAGPTANRRKGWKPIGASPYNVFTGSFNGQGYEIGDLFINRPDEDNVGLFGSVGYGVIKDIGVANVAVTGDGFVGGLVGSNSGNVSNSYSSGNVVGYSNAGGLVGDNSGTVNNSYSTGTVIGYSGVGGLVGANGASSNGIVSNSYSTGRVTGGGLVGVNDYGTVINSFWDTETSRQTASAGGRGKTTTEMKNATTFSGAGWNIIAVANPSTRNASYIWNIVDDQTYPLLSWHLSCYQGHISPTQIETETIPLGYFKLTVSPAEVCANIGEKIVIRCTIDCLINTIVDISSVNVLLFDSYGSMIRERAMTKYSAWSVNTVYTIVGDEAYYELKVTFTFPHGEPGQHSVYGAHSFPILIRK